MKILGGYIKDQEIIGISDIVTVHEHHPDRGYLSFRVITKSTAIEFQSETVLDPHIATKRELMQLATFRNEYAQIRYYIMELIGEAHEEYDFGINVEATYNGITEKWDTLQKMLKGSKSKDKGKWLKQLEAMIPGLISLKNYADKK